MKWYNALIGALFVIAMVVWAGTISGCGNLEVTKTVTKTVTATPKPNTTPSATPSSTPSPYLNADETAGLAELTAMTTELKHIYRAEVATMNYGIENGSFNGVVRRAGVWSDDFVALQKRYKRSNNGDYYGGKLTRLENLFESTLNHVRLYGRGLLQVVVNPNIGDAALSRAGWHSAYAERGLEKLATEIARLENEQGESY